MIENDRKRPDFSDAAVHIDARGLACPEPLLMCREALDNIAAGGHVHVMATDPHAELDFEVFAVQTGHGVIARHWLGGVLHVLIAKRASHASA